MHKRNCWKKLTEFWGKSESAHAQTKLLEKLTEFLERSESAHAQTKLLEKLTDFLERSQSKRNCTVRKEGKSAHARKEIDIDPKKRFHNDFHSVKYNCVLQGDKGGFIRIEVVDNRIEVFLQIG